MIFSVGNCTLIKKFVTSFNETGPVFFLFTRKHTLNSSKFTFPIREKYTGTTSDFAALFELTQSLVGPSDHGSILKPHTQLPLYCIAVI